MTKRTARRCLQGLPALLLVLLGASFTAAALGASLRAEVIEQILVKVNGEMFTKSDLETRQVVALRQSGKVDPNANPTDAQLRKLLDDLTPQLIVGVVDEMLLVQRGKELGYKMTDDQFKSIVDGIRKDQKLEDEAAFQAALKSENLTTVELRKNLERQMIVDKVRQNEVIGKIAVSPEDARAYYDAHLSDFTTPAEVTLREILIASKKTGNAAPTAADDAAALQTATEVRQRALAGDSFEKLAADFSDAPSKSNAGLIGPISLDDVSEDLRRLIGQMKVGDVTELLKAPNGYQILKLESKSDTKTAPFEEARDKISDRVFTGKRQAEYDKYLEKLRSEAIIEWKNADIQKAYVQGLEQIKAGVPSPTSE